MTSSASLVWNNFLVEGVECVSGNESNQLYIGGICRRLLWCTYILTNTFPKLVGLTGINCTPRIRSIYNNIQQCSVHTLTVTFLSRYDGVGGTCQRTPGHTVVDQDEQIQAERSWPEWCCGSERCRLGSPDDVSHGWAASGTKVGRGRKWVMVRCPFRHIPFSSAEYWSSVFRCCFGLVAIPRWANITVYNALFGLACGINRFNSIFLFYWDYPYLCIRDMIILWLQYIKLCMPRMTHFPIAFKLYGGCYASILFGNGLSLKCRVARYMVDVLLISNMLIIWFCWGIMQQPYLTVWLTMHARLRYTFHLQNWNDSVPTFILNYEVLQVIVCSVSSGDGMAFENVFILLCYSFEIFSIFPLTIWVLSR